MLRATRFNLICIYLYCFCFRLCYFLMISAFWHTKTSHIFEYVGKGTFPESSLYFARGDAIADTDFHNFLTLWELTQATPSVQAVLQRRPNQGHRERTRDDDDIALQSNESTKSCMGSFWNIIKSRQTGQHQLGNIWNTGRWPKTSREP